MIKPVTEIAHITLKEGVNIEVGDAKKRWEETLKTLAEQEGQQKCYYGTTLEDSTLLILMVDWASHDAHMKFVNAPHYGQFVENLSPVMSGVHIHHMIPNHFPPALLEKVPCVEFATFHCTETEFSDNVKAFTDGIGHPEGYLGALWGATHEDDIKKHAAQQDVGVKGGKGLVLCLGWESKEKHMKFRETETFRKLIYLLREKNSGAEVFHVKFTAT